MKAHNLLMLREKAMSEKEYQRIIERVAQSAATPMISSEANLKDRESLRSA